MLFFTVGHHKLVRMTRQQLVRRGMSDPFEKFRRVTKHMTALPGTIFPLVG